MVQSSEFLHAVSQRIAGRSVKDLYAIEAFCGTGTLTCELRRCGLQESIGVDHMMSRKLRAPAIKLDLTLQRDQEIFDAFLEDECLCYIHFAPPCGTSSRARDIRVRQTQKSRFSYWGDPPPLRSARYPDGLPSASGSSLKRVTQANLLYAWTGRTVAQCFRRGIFTSVENPHRSHMWSTSHWQQPTSQLPQLSVLFDHCMYNGTRKKRTKLVHTMLFLQHLQLDCDGQHQHEKWGFSRNSCVWATSLETAYPVKLCRSWASLFLDQLLELGAAPLPQELAAVPQTVDFGLNQAAVHKQPRSTRIPPLVSEFRDVVVLTGPAEHVPKHLKDEGWVIPATFQCSLPLTSLPAGTRLLRVQFLAQGESNCALADKEEGANPWGDASMFLPVPEQQRTDPGRMCKAVFGPPGQPEEFVERAACSLHPKHLVSGLPTEVTETIRKVCSTPAADLAKDRTATMRKWLSKVVELGEEERLLKESLAPHVSALMAAKRLKFFEHLLCESGHGDPELFRAICNGFDLAGPIPASNVYKKRKRFATLRTADLRSSAKRIRTGIIHSVRSSGDLEMDNALYEVTQEELRTGWLHGPYRPSDLSESATVTRRFAVRQNNKIRPIDDYTESLVNSTSASGETITLHGVETICATSALMMRHLKTAGASTGLSVKTWDLHKAYKQLCLSPEALQDSFLAVWCPDKKASEIYGQYVLPFGACASVHGFCRTSYAIWRIAVTLLLVVWTTYFDDYVSMCVPAESKHLDMILRISSEAKVLGLVLDLSGSPDGFCFVANTPSRKTELEQTINDVLERGSLSKMEGMRLRGRLLFAESQVFGRRATQPMRALSGHIHASRTASFSDQVRKL